MAETDRKTEEILGFFLKQGMEQMGNISQRCPQDALAQDIPWYAVNNMSCAQKIVADQSGIF